jgi:hypothetical protein
VATPGRARCAICPRWGATGRETPRPPTRRRRPGTAGDDHRVGRQRAPAHGDPGGALAAVVEQQLGAALQGRATAPQQLAEHVVEPVPLLLGGGHVQGADDLVAGEQLAVGGEQLQQLRIPGDGHPDQVEQGGVGVLEPRPWRADPRAGGGRLAPVLPVDQDRLAALAGHPVGGAGAHHAAAYHHDAAGHREWLMGR